MSAQSVSDAGLQPERTVLAWRRTIASIVVMSALSVKCLAAGPAGLTGMLLVSAVGVGCVEIGQRNRYRVSVLGSGSAASTARPGNVVLTAMYVALMGVWMIAALLGAPL